MAGEASRFNRVKVFSATKAREREELGDTVNRWLEEHEGIEITDHVVQQSSDSEFHCLSILIFYRSPPAVR
jgi:hypothetical protein